MVKFHVLSQHFPGEMNESPKKPIRISQPAEILTQCQANMEQDYVLSCDVWHIFGDS